MISRLLKITLLLLAFSASLPASAQPIARMQGKVISDDDGAPVPYASVSIKGRPIGSTCDAKGAFTLNAPAGDHIIVISAMGFKTEEHKIKLKNGSANRYTMVIRPQNVNVDKVTVLASGISIVKESPYNVSAIDATELHNTTLDIAHALEKLPGVKLRESGGLGSDMRFSLDGFSGRHVKFFMDGVPLDGVGNSFGINNIPINYAERLEVYKGVVPVEFGADALGGVVNIVTKKNRNSSFVDAAYSFGSFNTHKSYVNVGHVTKNGFMIDLNAFQNYSDNDYKISTHVTEFTPLPGGGYSEMTDTETTYKVKRFNDRYHNEAVVLKAGMVGKKYADRLLAGINLSQYSKEIQNGVRQEIVFGDKYTEGYTISPSIEYSKRNLFTKGLDVSFTANYNFNQMHNVDTAARKYNWFGEWIPVGSPGEQRFQDSKFKTDNWNTTFNVRYALDDMHSFVLNNVLSGFDRKTSSTASTSTSSTSFESFKKESRKNITGLAYSFNYKGKWNASVFGKYYRQSSKGPRQTAASSLSYEAYSEKVDDFGYGAAATYFFGPFQAKVSYEKAMRLPTTDEMFGDEDLELGSLSLKPEQSDNYNVNLSFGKDFGKHSVFIETGVLYRDSKDYIKRAISGENGVPIISGGRSYASHINFGKVKTIGFNADIRYNYSNWFSAGGNVTVQNIRDYEKYSRQNSLQLSSTYKERIPNIPQFFTNADVSFYIHDLAKKGNMLTVTYDNMYIQDFTLRSEGNGADGKDKVPEQMAHNLRLTYSMQKGKYNLSFECHNLTDENLYDNFMLQKAGRAFYGKLRIYLRK